MIARCVRTAFLTLVGGSFLSGMIILRAWISFKTGV